MRCDRDPGHGRWLTRWLRCLITVVLGASVARSAEPTDPGLLFELDRDRYVVTVRDLSTGEMGPVLRVAVGSPAHPTPPGEFRLYSVIHDPDWEPGETARRYGAERIEASPNGPLGIAKVPFSGSFALHGGANPFTVGKPVTLGCVRALNDELRILLDWLASRRALGRKQRDESGESPQPFTRVATLLIR